MTTDGRGENQRAKLAQHSFLKFSLPTAHVVTGVSASTEESPTEVTGEFARVAEALNTAKAAFDEIPGAEFDLLMRQVDLYAGLKRALRTEYGMQFATNATIKMYELLVQMGLMAGPHGALQRARVFHNAELPGAFIVAVNHYVRTMCPETNYDWVASSYYPGDAAPRLDGEGGILGDQVGIYAGNRGRWLMGPRPNALPAGAPAISGDLTDAAVVVALANAVHARFAASDLGPSGATLYTSDAGIDVSGDYNHQEENTSLLNFGQVLAGLLSLAPGGNLVTKQYTFVTPFSRSLIAVAAAHFEEAYITKPVASRPANSEVYFVGKGFRGISPGLASALVGRLAAARLRPLAPLVDTAAVDGVLRRASQQIHERQQVAHINEAIAYGRRYAGRLRDIGRLLGADERRHVDKWLSDNPVRQIREAYWVCAAGSVLAEHHRPGEDDE